MIARQHNRGFTLVEILVAMTLLAVIGVLGFRGLENIRHSSAHLSTMATRWQAIGRVNERIARDVRQALAIPGRTGDGVEAPAWQTRRLLDARPESAQLIFSRLGSGEGDVQRIGYRWVKQGAASGELSLVIWPAVDAVLPTRSYVLLDQLAGFELSYLDSQGQWLADWPATPVRALPRALRVVMALSEGGVVERIFDVPVAD